MKKIRILALVTVMAFAFAACGESKAADAGASIEEIHSSESRQTGTSDQSEPAAEEAARVENGRLSGMEPPEGWLLGEAMSEDQLIYLFKHDLYDEYPQDAPQLSIDINEGDTPEEKLAGATALLDDWEEEYESGEATIDGTFYHTVSSLSTGLLLIGARDEMTLSISLGRSLALDDPDVVAIISSLHVAAA